MPSGGLEGALEGFFEAAEQRVCEVFEVRSRSASRGPGALACGGSRGFAGVRGRRNGGVRAGSHVSSSPTGVRSRACSAAAGWPPGLRAGPAGSRAPRGAQS
jgi:hypothetical protein